MPERTDVVGSRLTGTGMEIGLTETLRPLLARLALLRQPGKLAAVLDVLPRDRLRRGGIDAHLSGSGLDDVAGVLVAGLTARSDEIGVADPSTRVLPRAYPVGHRVEGPTVDRRPRRVGGVVDVMGEAQRLGVRAERHHVGRILAEMKDPPGLLDLRQRRLLDRGVAEVRLAR